MENLGDKRYEISIRNSSKWKISKATKMRVPAYEQSLTKAKIII